MATGVMTPRLRQWLSCVLSPHQTDHDNWHVRSPSSVLLDQLKSAMESDHIYTEPGLTIRTLSETLKTPEHRLRVLINQGLGYRNFSAFLNSYRIEAVKAALNDPKNSRLPVLTIAMDVGFDSLAPFNRAFRDIEGMTPSAYRQTITFNPDLK